MSLRLLLFHSSFSLFDSQSPPFPLRLLSRVSKMEHSHQPPSLPPGNGDDGRYQLAEPFSLRTETPRWRRVAKIAMHSATSLPSLISRMWLQSALGLSFVITTGGFGLFFDPGGLPRGRRPPLRVCSSPSRSLVFASSSRTALTLVLLFPLLVGVPLLSPLSCSLGFTVALPAHQRFAIKTASFLLAKIKSSLNPK